MPSSLVTVFGDGAARLPSLPARAPAAASTCFVLPCSIAITTSARTHGRECRRPRRSRRNAKQPRMLPPHAARSAAARFSRVLRALSASARSRSSSALRCSRCSAALLSRSARRRCFRASRLARASSRQVKRCENPFALSGTPLPRPGCNRTAAKPVTASHGRHAAQHGPLATVSNQMPAPAALPAAGTARLSPERRREGPSTAGCPPLKDTA